MHPNNIKDSKTTKSDAGWTGNCDWAVFANPTLTHQQKIRKYADGALFDPAQRCLFFSWLRL